MPPKTKITKEDILNAAIALVQKEGAAALNARTVAAMLDCSTQPVFSNFATMEELRLSVTAKATALYQAYTQREIDSGLYPPYKASGMAYIRFAKEERELFKLLFMCTRPPEDQAGICSLTDDMEAYVRQNTGLSSADAKLFHLEIWACVHGIATMFVTDFVDLPWELVSKMVTDIYQGLQKQYAER